MDQRRGGQPAIRDLVVAGGGIAGLALAVLVKRRIASATVTLCDPALPSGPGIRAYAVAAGSRRVLETLGLWSTLEPRAQPIESMVITDSRADDMPRPAYLDFAGEAGLGEPFAHMVLETDLRAALRGACEAAEVPILPRRILGFHETVGALTLGTGGDPLRTRLLVAADGGRSRLRDLAGIRTVGWDYDQAGLVATLAHTVGHEGRATQHFLPSGPLAMLPLRAEDGSDRRVSLVWTVATAEARRLTALPAARFLDALENAVGYGYGTLTLEDGPTAHPLRLSLPRRLVGARFALVGDAARVIHPLAGQGLNLGLRDVATLADLVAVRLSLGLDPGDAETLQAYQRARRFDGVAMAAATDGLNRLFSNDSASLRLVRDLGLGLVDRVPALKQWFMRDAAGL